jgi:hypothetical protein
MDESDLRRLFEASAAETRRHFDVTVERLEQKRCDRDDVGDDRGAAARPLPARSVAHLFARDPTAVTRRGWVEVASLR